MVLKAFIKPFEAPQGSLTSRIQVNFYFNLIFCNAWGGKGLFETAVVKLEVKTLNIAIMAKKSFYKFCIAEIAS